MTRSPFEEELVDRLHALADRAPSTPPGGSEPAAVQPPAKSRGRIALLAAAAVTIVVLGAGGMWLFDRPDSGDVVATDGTTPPDERSSWPSIAGEWMAISAGPVDGRWSPAQIWTGTELIVWGGETASETSWADDGAAYDPRTGEWREIAASPLSARSGHVAVWTGTEMLVCCGRGPDGADRAAAAYDPAADSWRTLAEPPFDAEAGTATWTGSEMLVVAGAESRAWAYSLERDVWRELAQPPVRTGASADIAWTGTKAIVWPGLFGSSSGAVYDIAADTWDLLPPLPAIWGGSMVWTGEEVVVWGNSRADEDDAVGARIRLDGTDWRPIADDPLEPFEWWNGVPGSQSAVWTGTEMIVWAGAMGEDDATTRTLAYDPTSDSWRIIGPASATGFGPDMIWTGEVVVVMTDPVNAIRPSSILEPPARPDEATIRGRLPNGDGFEVTASPALSDRVRGISAGIIIDVDDGAEPIEGPVVGIAHFERVDGSERVGPSENGRSVVVVSGEWRLHIAIYDHVLDALGAETASVVFSAIEPIEVDAASDLPAFDLSAPLRWATDDEIPLQMEVSYPEFVVHRGCSSVSVACSVAGEVQVIPIAEVRAPAVEWAGNDVGVAFVPPVEPAPKVSVERFDVGPLSPRGGHSVTWTGSEVLVWGGSPDENGTELFDDGAAFDPSADTWRPMAPSPLSPRQYHATAWTGRELLVVGGDGRLDGAAYDPAADGWRPLPDLPFSLTTGAPASAWAGDRMVVWEPGSDRIAALTPDAQDWIAVPPTGLDVTEGVLRWEGEHLYAVGAHTASPSAPVPLQLARLEQAGWRVLPEIDLSIAGFDVAATPLLSGWASGQLVVWSDAGPDGLSAAFDPSTDQWNEIAPTTVPGCEARVGGIGVDDRLLAFGWCGDSAIYDVALDTWTPIAIEGLPQHRYTVLAGSEVINWGDTCCYGTGGQPFTVDAWRFTPPPPTGGP